MLNNNTLNITKLDLIFSKSCLRDLFISETLRRIPKLLKIKKIPMECLEKLKLVIQSIITSKSFYRNIKLIA